MPNIQSESEQAREALWTFPREWRVTYFGLFILLSIGFAVLGGVEFRGVGQWTDAPFTSLTSIIIGSGTASALLSLFLTETWRLIVTFSTWVAEKLEENLERSRERRRKEVAERERRIEKAVEQAVEKASVEARQRGRQEGRQEGRRQGHQEGLRQGYSEGLKAGLLEAQGKKPPPPPWDEIPKNGN